MTASSTQLRTKPADGTDAQPGERCRLGAVMTRLAITTVQLAEVVSLPKTVAFRLLTNEWPARMPDFERDHLRALITDWLAGRGANDDELANLWKVAQHRRMNRARDLPDPHKPNQSIVEEDPMLLPKQSLTPQARRHFKLFTNPFDGEVQTDEQMHVGDDLRYVREAAWQAMQHGGFVAVVGESGAGKTTMMGDLEQRLQHDGRAVIVIKPSVLGMEESSAKGQLLKSTDILHAIITTLQPEATVPQTLQARTVRAAKMLAASAESGAVHVLLIEEGHSLPDATLKHLKRLHEMRVGRRSLLAIVLLAQPELKQRLANGLRTGALREVAQRCELIELLPLDGDLGPYLQTRLNAASGGNRPLNTLIDDGGLQALRTRLTRKTAAGMVSMCYPLAVGNMVTRALNLAADLGVPLVTADVVKEC